MSKDSFSTYYITQYLEQDWRLNEQIALKTCDLFGSYYLDDDDLRKITDALAVYIRKKFNDLIHDDNGDNTFMVDMCHTVLSNVDWHGIASSFVECEYEAMEHD